MNNYVVVAVADSGVPEFVYGPMSQVDAKEMVIEWARASDIEETVIHDEIMDNDVFPMGIQWDEENTSGGAYILQLQHSPNDSGQF